MNAVFPIINWKINKFGLYKFVFTVDYADIGSIEFGVAKGRSPAHAEEIR